MPREHAPQPRSESTSHERVVAERRAYLQQQGYTFPAVNDDDGVLAQQWGVKVTPTIVLIKNGKVLHSTTGLASYWTLKTRIALVNALH